MHCLICRICVVNSVNSAHSVVHSTCHILTYYTANSHSGHHCGRIEACAALPAEVYTAGTVCPHLTESLCACYADICL